MPLHTSLVGGKGQAIVEFALVMPIFLLLVLGGGELAFLIANQWSYPRGVEVLADVAAEKISTEPGNSWRAGWNSVVRDEDEQRRCGDPNPELLFPDGQEPGDRVQVVWHCYYRPYITTMWDGLDLTVIGTSVIRADPNATPMPSETPEASG